MLQLKFFIIILLSALQLEANPSPKIKPAGGPIIFELEFLQNAELYKTANYLRTLGFEATVVTEPKEMIIIEVKSYNKALEKLTPIIPNLADIYRMLWKNGVSETVIYQAPDTDLFIKDSEITENLKVLRHTDRPARVTVIMREDNSSVIRYNQVVSKVERMGYRVTFADGYIDAGWIQFPAIEIEIPNNILSFKKAIMELSEIPEVNRFMYNRGQSPRAFDYVISFEDSVDLELQISRLLANEIEIYKVDKLLNRLFIHFPHDEERNKTKLEQIKRFGGLVMIKNLYENDEKYIDTVLEKNTKRVLLDIPDEILKGNLKYNEYSQKLFEYARREVSTLKKQGMIVVHYGVYAEPGEILIPEVVFTYKDKDSSKAEEILKNYKVFDNSNAPSGMVCSRLFN